MFDPFGGPVVHKDRLQNELQISVYRCRCLPLRENGNEPSPSVSVALGMAPAVNTDKKKAQAAPTFKNNFAFNVEVGDPVDCDITVYDHQTISKKVIGIVKLRDLTQGLSNRLPFRKWYPLESKDAQYVERDVLEVGLCQRALAQKLLRHCSDDHLVPQVHLVVVACGDRRLHPAPDLCLDEVVVVRDVAV